MIGYEYEIVAGNKIKGWRLTSKPRTDQDIEKNSAPLDKMNTPIKDSDGAIISQDDKNFILNPDGSISEIDHVQTASERVRKYSIDDKFRILIKAIQDHDDPEFMDMVNDLS